MDARIDLVADLNDEDDEGLGWSALSQASDPARIRPGTVSRSMVAGGVSAYLRHLVQHRDGGREVAVEDCLEP